jgi:hypothetical protein
MPLTFDQRRWCAQHLEWLAQLIEENWRAILAGHAEFPVPPTRIECIALCLNQAEARTGVGFDAWVDSMLSMGREQARALLEQRAERPADRAEQKRTAARS